MIVIINKRMQIKKIFSHFSAKYTLAFVPPPSLNLCKFALDPVFWRMSWERCFECECVLPAEEEEEELQVRRRWASKKNARMKYVGLREKWLQFRTSRFAAKNFARFIIGHASVVVYEYWKGVLFFKPMAKWNLTQVLWKQVPTYFRTYWEEFCIKLKRSQENLRGFFTNFGSFFLANIAKGFSILD